MSAPTAGAFPASTRARTSQGRLRNSLCHSGRSSPCDPPGNRPRQKKSDRALIQVCGALDRQHKLRCALYFVVERAVQSADNADGMCASRIESGLIIKREARHAVRAQRLHERRLPGLPGPQMSVTRRSLKASRTRRATNRGSIGRSFRGGQLTAANRTLQAGQLQW